MTLWYSLILVVILTLVGLFGSQVNGLQPLFGIVLPYIALVTFIIGIIMKVLKWAKSPVPFRIPTTCGQAKSLPWIKNDNLESPSNTISVIGRMILEILFFRSLFRNTRMEIKEGSKVVYASTKFLWMAGMAFHYTFLVILLRHFRFFVDPTPQFVIWIQNLDGFFQVGLPIFYLTDMVFLAAVSYLLLRRLADSKIRYISLAGDYFPLLLLLAIGTTGFLMRHFTKVDLIGVKELTVGLLSLQPVIPDGIGSLFFLHLFLVSCLLAYFPFSKLMHMAGVFLSPTRNLANNNRMKQHVNPWNYDVKLHPYEEYEDEFREVMRGAGLPLDRDPEEEKK
ncbi:menaquinol oxidoreductase [candidate division LCP-89 bacterium B3_LCP]|uniref:Menaquinol oxidoreductase n=1 Tax=candidate division LCP-89 bacterium B3_LCP TaxID=2012998 RepID=A0A532V0Q8_UNCL8|nr:MAG: menaquinol oxidoreductase [candidate division LCP-89 bacterium B3_LCP]